MEGDAGTSRLNPTAEAIEPPTESVADGRRTRPEDSRALELPSDAADCRRCAARRRQEHFGRGLAGRDLCVARPRLTAGAAVGGYLALQVARPERGHRRDEDALAVARAKECVAATQAPDVAAMTASQTKVIECATGDFGVQANLFASMLVDAYQAANVSVQVSDMRGAVEKHNDDGSVDVLVAVRVKVTNSQAADQEQGYRLRVNMAPADGTYKINRAGSGHVVTAYSTPTTEPPDRRRRRRPLRVLAGARGGPRGGRLLPGVAVIVDDGASVARRPPPAGLAVVGVHGGRRRGAAGRRC